MWGCVSRSWLELLVQPHCANSLKKVRNSKMCVLMWKDKQCSYYQNLKCQSKNLCPLLWGYLKISPWFLCTGYYFLTVCEMQDIWHPFLWSWWSVDIFLVKLSILLSFLRNAFLPMLMVAMCFCGGRILWTLGHYLCCILTDDSKPWTLGTQYVQRRHDFPHFSFSGNESYLELKAENCLLLKVQTLIFFSFYSCGVLLFWWLMTIT